MDMINKVREHFAAYNELNELADKKYKKLREEIDLKEKIAAEIQSGSREHLEEFLALVVEIVGIDTSLDCAEKKEVQLRKEILKMYTDDERRISACNYEFSFSVLIEEQRRVAVISVDQDYASYAYGSEDRVTINYIPLYSGMEE